MNGVNDVSENNENSNSDSNENTNNHSTNISGSSDLRGKVNRTFPPFVTRQFEDVLIYVDFEAFDRKRKEETAKYEVEHKKYQDRDFRDFSELKNDGNDDGESAGDEYRRQLDWLEAVLGECEVVEVVTERFSEFGYFTTTYSSVRYFIAYIEAQGLQYAAKDIGIEDIEGIDLETPIPDEVMREIEQAVSNKKNGEKGNDDSSS